MSTTKFDIEKLRNPLYSVFISTYTVSAYHHSKVNLIQAYVIKFINDLNYSRFGGFCLVLQYPPTIKLTAMIYREYQTHITIIVTLHTHNGTGSLDWTVHTTFPMMTFPLFSWGFKSQNLHLTRSMVFPDGLVYFPPA